MYKNKEEKKLISPQQALSRLMELCSRSEKCTGDASVLLEKWGITEATRASILQTLVEQRYIDNRRYAAAFVRDKMVHNKWGRRKIFDALRMKRLPSDVIEEALSAIPSETEQEQLIIILRRKQGSVKAETKYQKRDKLVRYALSKGFLLEDILEVIDEIMAEK